VTEAELQEAKDFLKGKIILHLENSSELAEWYAKQSVLTSEVLTPEQKFALFDKVTLEDIKKVANEVFKKEYINLAMIGPLDGSDKFRKLLEL